MVGLPTIKKNKMAIGDLSGNGEKIVGDFRFIICKKSEGQFATNRELALKLKRRGGGLSTRSRRNLPSI